MEKTAAFNIHEIVCGAFFTEPLVLITRDGYYELLLIRFYFDVYFILIDLKFGADSA